MPGGSAGTPAAIAASRSFRPCSGAIGQTAAAVDPTAPHRTGRWTWAFSDGVEVADQVCPAQLALMDRQVVRGGEESLTTMPPKASLSSSIAAAPERPRPGTNTVTAAVTITHRLLTGGMRRFCHRLCQGCTQAHANRGDGAAADLHPQQLIQQSLDLAETQREGTAQQTHQGIEPGAARTGFHIRRERRTGAARATGADQAMQPVIDHQRRDRRNLNHVMPQGLWILTLQQRAAAAAGIRVTLHHLTPPLDRQQLRPGSGMTRLAATLAATAMASLRWLQPRPIAGGWFRGVARAAADPLPQAGQLSDQGGELATQLMDLFLLIA